MADLEPSQPRVPHPGVDAQSWLGFEQRVQAKRFHALLASAREAIAAGNLALATHTLEEARELRPQSPEVAELAATIARAVPGDSRAQVWRRAGHGALLLAAGVIMVVALDQTRLLPGSIGVLAPPSPQLLHAVPTVRGLTLTPASPVDQQSPALRDRLDAASAVAPAVVQRAADERPAAPRGDASEALTNGEARPASAGREGEPPVTRPRPADSRDAVPAVTDMEEEPAPGPSVPSHDDRDSVEDAVVRAPIPAAARPVAPSVAPLARPGTDDQHRVEDVLQRYARAYGNLDVPATIDVWPSVDRRALARAFDGLASQSVSFDDCDIHVEGTRANASCRGSASYVGKVGRTAPRTEPRLWRFELRRDGEAWKIAHAEARRTSS
jgi:hypothetical protein